MKTYRLMVMDMGHVNAMEFLQAENDQVAIRQAEETLRDQERELWEGDRFVARFRPQ